MDLLYVMYSYSLKIVALCFTAVVDGPAVKGTDLTGNLLLLMHGLLFYTGYARCRGLA